MNNEGNLKLSIPLTNNNIITSLDQKHGFAKLSINVERKICVMKYNYNINVLFNSIKRINIFLITLTLFGLIFLGMSFKDNLIEKDNWIDIFDGETLDDWDGDPTYWRVENGKIIGEVTEETLLVRNSFLIWRGGLTRDFEIKVEYRVSNEGNSGINYRSQQVDDVPYALRGYQADLDGSNRYTGMNYEERRRTTIATRGEKVLLPDISDAYSLNKYTERNQWNARIVQESLGDPDSLTEHINEGWNDYHIIAEGNRLKHFVNGVLMSDVTDEDPINRRFEGLLGVQVHVGPPMTVEYKNFRIKHL